jgi:hypothetical protein
MIRVPLPDRTLGITWAHPMTVRPSTWTVAQWQSLTAAQRTADGMRRRRWKTVCTIHVLTEGKVAKGAVPIAEASCSTNHRDTFDKEVGRKLSLKRALIFTSLSKTDRATVWRTYHARPRTGGTRE